MRKKWFLVGFMVSFFISPEIVVFGVGKYTEYRIHQQDLAYAQAHFSDPVLKKNFRLPKLEDLNAPAKN